jgi:hypothetical protein
MVFFQRRLERKARDVRGSFTLTADTNLEKCQKVFHLDDGKPVSRNGKLTSRSMPGPSLVVAAKPFLFR